MGGRADTPSTTLPFYLFNTEVTYSYLQPALESEDSPQRRLHSHLHLRESSLTVSYMAVLTAIATDDLGIRKENHWDPAEMPSFARPRHVMSPLSHAQPLRQSDKSSQIILPPIRSVSHYIFAKPWAPYPFFLTRFLTQSFCRLSLSYHCPANHKSQPLPKLRQHRQPPAAMERRCHRAPRPVSSNARGVVWLMRKRRAG